MAPPRRLGQKTQVKNWLSKAPAAHFGCLRVVTTNLGKFESLQAIADRRAQNRGSDAKSIQTLGAIAAGAASAGRKFSNPIFDRGSD
jgi:hypothetical protein